MLVALYIRSQDNEPHNRHVEQHDNQRKHYLSVACINRQFHDFIPFPAEEKVGSMVRSFRDSPESKLRKSHILSTHILCHVSAVKEKIYEVLSGRLGFPLRNLGGGSVRIPARCR